jgi:hypothetical protein
MFGDSTLFLYICGGRNQDIDRSHAPVLHRFNCSDRRNRNPFDIEAVSMAEETATAGASRSYLEGFSSNPPSQGQLRLPRSVKFF